MSYCRLNPILGLQWTRSLPLQPSRTGVWPPAWTQWQEGIARSHSGPLALLLNALAPAHPQPSKTHFPKWPFRKHAQSGQDRLSMLPGHPLFPV